MLEWEDAPEAPPPCLPEPDGSFRHGLGATPSPCGTRLEVRGPVMALSERSLALALERVMRRIADAAAVSGAVLEMRVLKEEAPRSAPPELVEALAADLWRGGFDVAFAPCWAPAGPDGLAVGAAGQEERLRGFFLEHPAWGLS